MAHDRIPVYLHGQSRHIPYCYVTVAEAQGWIKDGIAKITTKRGNSITLYARKLLKLRGQSANPKIDFMDKVAGSCWYHATILEMMRPHFEVRTA